MERIRNLSKTGYKCLNVTFDTCNEFPSSLFKESFQYRLMLYEEYQLRQKHGTNDKKNLKTINIIFPLVIWQRVEKNIMNLIAEFISLMEWDLEILNNPNIRVKYIHSLCILFSIVFFYIKVSIDWRMKIEFMASQFDCVKERNSFWIIWRHSKYFYDPIDQNKTKNIQKII